MAGVWWWVIVQGKQRTHLLLTWLWDFALDRYYMCFNLIIKFRNFIVSLPINAQVLDLFFLFLFRLKQEPRAVQSVWPNTTRFSGKLTDISIKKINIFISKHTCINKHIHFTFSAHLLVFLMHRIEEELGDKAQFAGKNFRNPLNWGHNSTVRTI